jgi:hypothetical protein
VTALLVGGCALYLATFGYMRWRMFRTLAWPRLGAAAVCVALLPIGAHLPSLALLITLVTLVVALNLVEHAVTAANARGRGPVRAATPASPSLEQTLPEQTLLEP